MKGKITIEASDRGYGIDAHVEDMCTPDKLELMHAVAVALHMDDDDMHLFMIAETLGILKDTERQVRCTTNEQVQSLLKGEQPEGITIDVTELRRQLNES